MSSQLTDDRQSSSRFVPCSQLADVAGAARPKGVAGAISPWIPLLEKLFCAFDGVLEVRFPDRSSALFGSGDRAVRPPLFTLCLRDLDVVRTLLLGPDRLRFAEAYFCGELDIEGDLFAALSLKDHLHDLRLPLLDRLKMAWRMLGAKLNLVAKPADRLQLPIHANTVTSHSRAKNREAASFHDDISNDFYDLWLDDGMVYSCAYFKDPDFSLEQAQTAKLDHICRKLQFKPGQRFLDIGCGWGALILHAAQHYGVYAHGITLSKRQFELARARIKAAGLKRMVTVAHQDYRDLDRSRHYDKIASVGMFEHVGLQNLPQYFEVVRQLLKPDGHFLNHGITHDKEGWRDTISSRFINHHVFPDGELDTVSNVQQVMERSRFEIIDVEGLRPHYAKTLRHWVHRLEQNHGRALEFVNEATFRVWRLYMAASVLGFESGDLGVYQILAGPRGTDNRGFPMTRHYMYPAQDAQTALTPQATLKLA